MQKDLLLAAPTQQDMREWINAFRLHQIDTLEARSKFLEKKLEKVGVKVPRGTVLLSESVAKTIGQMPSQATLGREALGQLGHGAIEEEESSGSEDEEEKKEDTRN